MEILWGIVPCFRSSDFYKFRRCIEINVPAYNISSSSSLIMSVVTSKCFETRVPHLLSYLVYFILNLLRIFVSSISIFLSLTFSSFFLFFGSSSLFKISLSYSSLWLGTLYCISSSFPYRGFKGPIATNSNPIVFYRLFIKLEPSRNKSHVFLLLKFSLSSFFTLATLLFLRFPRGLYTQYIR